MNTSKIATVARYTFKEFLKSRILYITLGLGGLLILLTFVATEFTYGVPEKIAIDFGLGMLSLSSLGISIFMGATLLSKEIDSRTVYVVISRPVPRWAFISGKLIGLIGILIVNIGVLSVLTLGASALFGGEVAGLTLLAILFNLLESILVMMVVVCLSLFTNTIIASSVSMLFLFLGHAVKETQSLSFVVKHEALKHILEIYHLVLPGFYRLNLKDFVIYQKSVPASYLYSSAAYGVLYSLFLFGVVVFVFNRKNLD